MKCLPKKDFYCFVLWGPEIFIRYNRVRSSFTVVLIKGWFGHDNDKDSTVHQLQDAFSQLSEDSQKSGQELMSLRHKDEKATQLVTELTAVSDCLRPYHRQRQLRL